MEHIVCGWGEILRKGLCSGCMLLCVHVWGRGEQLKETTVVVMCNVSETLMLCT